MRYEIRKQRLLRRADSAVQTLLLFFSLKIQRRERFDSSVLPEQEELNSRYLIQIESVDDMHVHAPFIRSLRKYATIVHWGRRKYTKCINDRMILTT